MTDDSRTACSKRICGIRYKCMHPTCPDYDLCANCESMPIEVHPANHPMLKMRDRDTVIPTVYRVGGTTMIPTRPAPAAAAAQPVPAPPPTTEAAVSAKEISVQKSEASVQLSQPQTTEAAVSAVASDIPEETHVRAASPAPMIPTLSFEPAGTQLSASPEANLQLLVDYFARLSSESQQEVAQKPNQAPVSIPVPMCTPSLLSSFLERQPPARSVELRATFISNNNIDDGQAFPVGAEFVKSWLMHNDGDVDWPETTEVIFVAGDRLAAFSGAPSKYHVGRVQAGAFADIYAGDMKVSSCNSKVITFGS